MDVEARLWVSRMLAYSISESAPITESIITESIITQVDNEALINSYAEMLTW